MSLRLGDVAPDFEVDTTEGQIRFHEWIGDSWAVLFSHPKDFTPVCTTELGYMAKLKPEFDKRNTKIIGLSVDPVDKHAQWSNDIKETQGFAPNYPMIGDTELKVSKLYGMLPAELAGTSEGRTAADNQTVRNVFVIGPDKKIKLILVYPMTTGRNFDEVLRVHRLAAADGEAQGVDAGRTGSRASDVIIAGSVSDDDAKKTYPDGWKSPKAVHPHRSAAQGVTVALNVECCHRDAASLRVLEYEAQPHTSLVTGLRTPVEVDQQADSHRQRVRQSWLEDWIDARHSSAQRSRRPTIRSADAGDPALVADREPPATGQRPVPAVRAPCTWLTRTSHSSRPPPRCRWTSIAHPMIRVGYRIKLVRSLRSVFISVFSVPLWQISPWQMPPTRLLWWPLARAETSTARTRTRPR